MPYTKLKYDRRLGRMEVWVEGGTSPRMTLNDEQFADLLQQIFAFVEQNSPRIRQASRSLWKRRFGKSVRAEAWQWLGGAVKNKLFGFLQKKQ